MKCNEWQRQRTDFKAKCDSDLEPEVAAPFREDQKWKNSCIKNIIRFFQRIAELDTAVQSSIDAMLSLDPSPDTTTLSAEDVNHTMPGSFPFDTDLMPIFSPILQHRIHFGTLAS